MAAALYLKPLGFQGPKITGSPERDLVLDRRTLSNDQDPYLHSRPERCAVLQVTSGRWRLRCWDKTRAVHLAHDREGYGFPGTTRALIDLITGRATFTVPFPQEFDLYDGRWLLGVQTDQQWWFVQVDVIGQPQLRPTVWPEEGGTLGRWPTPTCTDPVRRIREYISVESTERDAPVNIRRLSLAYHYRDAIRQRPGAEPVETSEVAIALDLYVQSRVRTLREEMQKILWGAPGRNLDSLQRFLVDQALLTVNDVEEAEELASEYRRNGRADAARRRFEGQARRNRQGT